MSPNISLIPSSKNHWYDAVWISIKFGTSSTSLMLAYERRVRCLPYFTKCPATFITSFVFRCVLFVTIQLQDGDFHLTWPRIGTKKAIAAVSADNVCFNIKVLRTIFRKKPYLFTVLLRIIIRFSPSFASPLQATPCGAPFMIKHVQYQILAHLDHGQSQLTARNYLDQVPRCQRARHQYLFVA